MSEPFPIVVKRPSSMLENEFVQTFAAVYENSPWVASRSWKKGISAEHDSISRLAELFAATLAEASHQEKLQLILGHPDLAGKAAVRGQLSAESSSEQSSAGIDCCSEEEFNRFEQLNSAYKAKFQFPFIMAVRGSSRAAILQQFENRINNNADSEFATALSEINKIALLRLKSMQLSEHHAS